MQAGALNTTGMTRHHRTPTPTDPAGSDQTTHSACLLTPPPAFPGVGRVAATSSLLCSVATHEQGAAHPTDTRWHAGTYRLPRLMCTGQGLILTESLPLYILCQKPEYTKGNLALSTKQEHGAGPPLPIPGPGLDSRGGSWRGGGRCRSCRPGGTRLLSGVCARGSALHPSESGEGLPEMGLSSRHHQNLLPKGSSKPTSRGPTPSPARPVSAAQSRHLLQKVLPTTVWAPGVQGLGERTEWRSKGPVASVWSELSLRGGRQCGSPGPAPPRHPPETRLGKACRRKAIRSHGPRSPQERERAAPWPVPHGGLVPAVPCPTE